jgi:hypothetical protein
VGVKVAGKAVAKDAALAAAARDDRAKVGPEALVAGRSKPNF